MSGESLSGISSVGKSGEVQKQDGVSVGATLIKRGSENQTETVSSSPKKPVVETKDETQSDVQTAFEAKKTPISEEKVGDLKLLKDGLDKLGTKSPLSTITPESLQLGREGLKKVDLKQVQVQKLSTPIPKDIPTKVGEKISEEIHKDTGMIFEPKKSELFKKFAEKEFSQENGDFLVKLDSVCKKPTLESLKKLYTENIKDLNVSSSTIKSVDDAIKTGNVAKILESMKPVITEVKSNISDTTLRFKQSDDFKAFEKSEVVSDLKDSLINVPTGQNKDTNIKDFIFNPNKAPFFEKSLKQDNSMEDFRFLSSFKKVLDKPNITVGDLAPLYANYFSPSASSQINIGENEQKLVNSFKSNLEKGDVTSALKDLKGIATQSETNLTDSFRGFIQKPEYKEAIKQDAKNNITSQLQLNKNDKFDVNNFLFDPKMSKSLEGFAKKEWSLENVSSLTKIKSILSDDKTSEKQKMEQLKPLYEKYIKKGSESEINISDKERTNFKNALNKGDFTETLKALEPISKSLKTNVSDTFSRFKVSSDFKAYVRGTELKSIEALPLRKQLSALDDAMKQGGTVANVARDWKSELLNKYVPKIPMNEPDNMSTFISDFKTATYHFKTSIFGGQIDKVNKSLENLENASYSDNVKDKLDALDNSIKEVKNFMSTRGADSSKSQWVEALGGRLEESKKMLLEKSSYTKDGKDYTLQSGLKEGLGNLKVDINNFDKTLDDAKLNAKNLMQLSDPKSEFVWSVLSSKKIGDDVNDRLNSIINVVSEKYPKLKPEQQLALSKKINDGLLEGLPNKRSEDGNSFTVDGKNYKVIKQLGEGGMGIAFLIQNEETGHKLVAKGFKSQDGFFEEIDAHNMATGKPEHEHTNVSKFHGATIDSKGNGFAFQEFADGGDIKHLQETIKKFTDNGILSHSDSVIVKQYLANQIVQGMIHVNETRDMVHMDIKPDNFMFDKTSGTVKVIDFGLAQKNDKPEFKGGTAGYIAPEFMDANNRRIDKVGDIWSIGTTIQELVTGTKVFDGPKMGQADQKAIDFAKSGKFLRNVKDTKGKEIGTEPTAIAKVINNMLSGKPEDRMKFSELAKQPYFTDPLGSEERAKGLLSKMLDVMAKETDTVKKDTPFDEKKDFLKTEFQRELTKIPH